MKLGVSTYTYTWAFGVSGFPPPRPMTPVELIKKAIDHGLQRVQIADNYPLEKLNAEELKELAEFALKHNIIIEVGARGLKPERLDIYLAITRLLGAPFLRFVIDDKGYEPEIQEIIDVVKKKINAFKEAGVVLAIENHDRFTCSELVHIIQHTDPTVVGICLDTVNSFGAGEGVQGVLDKLMPYTFNLHIKDFAIQRKYHQMGFDISGKPAGSGFLEIPQMVKQLQEYEKCFSCTLELWTPPSEMLENTIEKERSWAEQSLEYLKETGLFRDDK
jgi:sugar phosphate isomerase/epimerase